MEKLKKFNTKEEYQEWKDSDDYSYPNVCKVADEIVYNDYPDYFWIEALEDLTFSSDVNNWYTSYYSYDKVNWNKCYNSGYILRKGQKAYFKCVYSIGDGRYFKLVISGRFNVGGSILSIFYGDDYMDYLDYNFVSDDMSFSALQSSKVVNAKELVLPLCNRYNAHYFSRLFYGCTLLISAPRIPKLDDTMLEEMFSGCTSLKKAPTLRGDYHSTTGLFKGCTSLTYIKDLTIGNGIYKTDWVSGVSPTGTFIANSKITNFTRGVNGIPEGWDLYLYDEDNDRYVVKFKVNGIPYEYYTDEPKDITWNEFINSEYNTNGFTAHQEDGATAKTIKFGDNYVLLSGNKVLITDKVILNTSYTIGQPTTTTELTETTNEEE